MNRTKERVNEKDASKMAEVKAKARWRTRWSVIGIEIITLFLFWILLSGRYTPKNIIMGLCAAALVTYFTNHFLYVNYRASKEAGLGTKFIIESAMRWLSYTPWLLIAIIKANLQVASILLKPKLDIDPGLLSFKTQLKRKASLVTLANSITLTPGTIVLELRNNTFVIHSLVRGCASDLETALMQNKAGYIFGENPEQAPNCTWVHSIEELEK
jgi:multicomponent Na+:H+ antiporter subunit E